MLPSAPRTMEVPLVDVRRQHNLLQDKIHAAVLRVCMSGQYVLGPDCVEFEQRMAASCQAKHALGCASGSDALLLALMAYGIGPGDEVLVPSYTFFATAGAVARLGATAVFVDIEPRGFAINPDLLEAAITRSTRAIIPVHLYGQCAQMDRILQIARSHQLAVIEDAAQSILATYDGVPCGSLGDIGCFSYYPTKNLGCYGDGGLLTTNDDGLAAQLKMLRVHGESKRYYHQLVGINSRLDSMQAAILNVKHVHLREWTAARRERAATYTQMFKAAGCEEFLQLPTELPRCGHVWNQYVVRVGSGKRDALREHLTQCQVGTQIYYPVPLHQQVCFRDLGYGAGSLPETERAAAETLALPIYPELTVSEQEYVVDCIARYFVGPTTKRSAVPRPQYLDVRHFQSTESDD